MTTKKIAAVALAASAIIAQAPAHAEGVQHDRGFKSSLIAVSKAKAIKAKKTSKFVGHKGLHLDRKAPVVKAKAFKAPVIKAKAFKAPVVKKNALKASSFNRGFKNTGFRNNGFKAKAFKAGFGYSPFLVAKLKNQALGACSAQLRHDAYKFGYKGVKLTGADVKHVGKNKFIVHAGAKLHDGFSINHEPYKCTVAHGKVIDAYKPKKLRF